MLERLQAFTKFDPQSALGYMLRRGYSDFVCVVVFMCVTIDLVVPLAACHYRSVHPFTRLVL